MHWNICVYINVFAAFSPSAVKHNLVPRVLSLPRGREKTLPWERGPLKRSKAQMRQSWKVFAFHSNVIGLRFQWSGHWTALSHVGFVETVERLLSVRDETASRSTRVPTKMHLYKQGPNGCSALPRGCSIIWEMWVCSAPKGMAFSRFGQKEDNYFGAFVSYRAGFGTWLPASLGSDF